MALAIAGILVATLIPDAAAEPLARCLLCAERWLADLLRNIILFVPFGLTASRPGCRAWPVVVAAALLSGAIEISQLAIPGRDPSLRDTLGNAAGAALGFSGVRALDAWRSVAGTDARRLALLSAGGASLVLFLTAALFAPALPASQWFGGWTPQLARLGTYDGRVLSATLGTIPLPSHDLSNSEEVRARMLAGDSLRVLVIAGSPRAGLAPILNIADDRPREIVLFGASGHDLVYRYRSRSRALWLEQPELRQSGALRGIPPGDTVMLGVDGVGPLACLRVGARAECPRLGTGSGWALVVAQSMVPAPLRTGMDVAWIVGLLLPVGFFAAAGGAAAGPLLTAGSLIIAPWAAGLGTPRLSDLLAGAAGLGLGTALAWARHRSRGLRRS